MQKYKKAETFVGKISTLEMQSRSAFHVAGISACITIPNTAVLFHNVYFEILSINNHNISE